MALSLPSTDPLHEKSPLHGSSLVQGFKMELLPKSVLKTAASPPSWSPSQSKSPSHELRDIVVVVCDRIGAVGSSNTKVSTIIIMFMTASSRKTAKVPEMLRPGKNGLSLMRTCLIPHGDENSRVHTSSKASFLGKIKVIYYMFRSDDPQSYDAFFICGSLYQTPIL
jgi:hypothetical protein